ncbi:hypothetical protein FIBSPDRAFT_939134 [Athelia psychrophila]|uniref:F-box domain-containing protein n=1 Tax=Athelia psychrophila TaxID=1759441 RepID=A0A165X3V9_9AGAM|nr:hypothetical protein FIBSPDRAFT_939134 [Fibularhizoctonia sp. CBS 109695]
MRSFPVPPVNMGCMRSMTEFEASAAFRLSGDELFWSLRSVMDGAERMCDKISGGSEEMGCYIFSAAALSTFGWDKADSMHRNCARCCEPGKVGYIGDGFGHVEWVVNDKCYYIIGMKTFTSSPATITVGHLPPQFSTTPTEMGSEPVQRSIPPSIESAEPKGSISPIANLPHEILSFIFKIECDNQSLMEEDTICPSLRVSQVSQTWRSIAISTATLWTTLSTLPARPMPFYEMLRDRSSGALLDIIIQDTPASDYTEQARALLVFAIGLAHRWRSLAIKAPLIQIFALASLRNLACPHLKTLNFSRAGPATPPTHILTGGAPRLTHWDCPDLSGRPPLTALTHLNLSAVLSQPVVYAELRAILREISSTLLYLSLMVSFDTADIFDKPIVMPVLASASFGAIDVAQAASIVTGLMSIFAPRLGHLVITSEYPLSQQLCLEMFNRSTSSYNYPQLRMVGLGGNVGQDVLRLFPSLSLLLLSGTYNRLDVGHILDPEQSHFSSILPDLAMIMGPSESEVDVQRFIAARAAAGLLIPRWVPDTRPTV